MTISNNFYSIISRYRFRWIWRARTRGRPSRQRAEFRRRWIWRARTSLFEGDPAAASTAKGRTGRGGASGTAEPRRRRRGGAACRDGASGMAEQFRRGRPPVIGPRDGGGEQRCDRRFLPFFSSGDWSIRYEKLLHPVIHRRTPTKAPLSCCTRFLGKILVRKWGGVGLE